MVVLRLMSPIESGQVITELSRVPNKMSAGVPSPDENLIRATVIALDEKLTPQITSAVQDTMGKGQAQMEAVVGGVVAELNSLKTALEALTSRIGALETKAHTGDAPVVEVAPAVTGATRTAAAAPPAGGAGAAASATPVLTQDKSKPSGHSRADAFFKYLLTMVTDPQPEPPAAPVQNQGPDVVVQWINYFLTTQDPAGDVPRFERADVDAVWVEMKKKKKYEALKELSEADSRDGFAKTCWGMFDKKQKACLKGYWEAAYKAEAATVTGTQQLDTSA